MEQLAADGGVNSRWRVILVGVAATALLLTMEALVRPCAIDGFYFQLWSAETLMQTVSLIDLQQAPWTSLGHIHIQPPLFDSLRALLAALLGGDRFDETLRAVDGALYGLWALAFGAMVALVHAWLAQLASPRFALGAALLFALHPAALFYATMLDTTFVSALLILWFHYLLWRLARHGGIGTLWLLGLAALLLFFSRSVFQWPWILLLGMSLLLIGQSRRRVLLFLLVVGGISGLYLGKQYLQFGLLSTSSFAGSNLARSVGVADNLAYWNHLSTHGGDVSPDQPTVLTRVTKATGAPNFNHRAYLELHRELLADYKDQLATANVSVLIANYWENLQIWLGPSSDYSEHRIVDRLPWRSLYDTLFSRGWLSGLLLLAVLYWALVRRQRGELRRDLGLLLPLLFVFAVTVLFEKGENMRLKFLIEPLLYLFIAVQFYHFGMGMRALLPQRAAA